MSVTHKAPVDCDFCDAAFEDAVAALKADPAEVTIVCSYMYWRSARDIQNTFGCSLHLVPDELLKAVDHWAVCHGSNVYWSPGA